MIISLKGKKGQLFTILGIMLIVLMFLSFDIYSSINDKKSIKTRVKTMDSFLKSMEKNMERYLIISGERIILIAEEKMINGYYLADAQDFFNDTFFNDTEDPASLMYGENFQDIVDSVNGQASKINVEVFLNNSQVNVSQDDPWHLKFSLKSDFILKDKQGLAQWNKTQHIDALIPIERFYDPILAYETRKLKNMTRTPYEGNYVSGSDYSNITIHVDNGYFAANPSAPSFLKRLEGDLSSDPNGIETFVNIPQLRALPPGIHVTDESKTIIDYIYFSSDDPQPITQVSAIHSWFKIDDGHKAKYNIT